MIITVRKENDVAILDLSGNLVLGDPVSAFREKIGEVLEAGTKAVAINLASVSFVDSSGIGAMLGARTSVEAAGGQCRYFAALPRVIHTLETTRMHEVLNLHPSEASALASFDATS
ncbi:MAG: STAS domain-containing protein [Acidobacteriia bacterium]|nr:STAS domain-containing protein [Terriglobia bacterium]